MPAERIAPPLAADTVLIPGANIIRPLGQVDNPLPPIDPPDNFIKMMNKINAVSFPDIGEDTQQMMRAEGDHPPLWPGRGLL